MKTDLDKVKTWPRILGKTTRAVHGENWAAM